MCACAPVLPQTGGIEPAQTTPMTPISPNRAQYRCLRKKRPSKPYEFIGPGAMDVTKPYEFIGFGDIHTQFRSVRHFKFKFQLWTTKLSRHDIIIGPRG